MTKNDKHAENLKKKAEDFASNMALSTGEGGNKTDSFPHFAIARQDR